MVKVLLDGILRVRALAGKSGLGKWERCGRGLGSDERISPSVGGKSAEVVKFGRPVPGHQPLTGSNPKIAPRESYGSFRPRRDAKAPTS
jgi:hypothetical protein